MNRKNYSFMIFGFLLLTQVSFAKEPVCKEVDESWSWFADHAVFIKIDYFVDVKSTHKVRVATGISIGGNPLGSREELKGPGNFEVTGYGVGAVHIKKISGEGKASVCVDLKRPSR